MNEPDSTMPAADSPFVVSSSNNHNIKPTRQRIEIYDRKWVQQYPHQKMRQQIRRCTGNDSSSSGGSISIKTIDSADVDTNRATEVFKDVLIEEHENILDQIDVKNTLLLDGLVAADVLSESDVERVRVQKSRKDQNRELLLTLHGLNKNSIVCFIECLQEDFSHLSMQLQVKLDKLLSEYEDKNISFKCTVCDIQNKVNFRDVIDRLFSKKIIDTKLMTKVSRCITNELGWQQIKPALRTESHVEELVEALRQKHTDLADLLRKYKIKKFHCFCGQIHKKLCNKLNNLNRNSSSCSHTSSDILSSTSRSSDSVNENLRGLERISVNSEGQTAYCCKQILSKMDTEFQDKQNHRGHSLAVRRANSLPHTIANTTTFVAQRLPGNVPTNSSRMSADSTSFNNLDLAESIYAQRLPGNDSTNSSRMSADSTSFNNLDLAESIYDNNFDNVDIDYSAVDVPAIRRNGGFNRKAIRRRSDEQK